MITDFQNSFEFFSWGGGGYNQQGQNLFDKLRLSSGPLWLCVEWVTYCVRAIFTQRVYIRIKAAYIFSIMKPAPKA